MVGPEQRKFEYMHWQRSISRCQEKKDTFEAKNLQTITFALVGKPRATLRGRFVQMQVIFERQPARLLITLETCLIATLYKQA